jgi:hypothetical protein
LLFGANPIEKLKAAQGSTIAAWGACVEEEIMTREARLMSGTILITVPTIQYGGYFLLTSLMNKSGGYMENPLRQNFFRAGHAHAGVIVILSLVCQILSDAAVSSHPLALVRSNRGTAFGNSHFGGVLLLGAAADRDSSEWSSLSDLRRGIDSRCCGSHSRHWVA